jgi:hypothetical protein
LALALLAVACLALLHIVPRLRLSAYKSSLKAAGARLTLQELAPPAVADHQAAARRFLAAAQALSKPGSVLPAHAPAAMQMVAPGRARVGWQQPDLHRPDSMPAQLAQRYGLKLPSTNASPASPPPVTWDDLAAELDAGTPALDEIRRVCQAAAFDWGIDYAQGF